MSKIRKNYVYNILLTVFPMLIQLIMFPYITRTLGPEGNGKVQLALSFVAYFSILSQLGLPTYGIRVVAQASNDRKTLGKEIRELLFINFFTTFLTTFLYLFIIFSIGRFQEERKLYAVVGLMVLANTSGVEWLYRGVEEYKILARRVFVSKLAALILTILFVRNESNYLLYAIIVVGSTLAVNLYSFYKAMAMVGLENIRGDKEGIDWKKHLKPLGIFFGMACATTIYTNLDNVMLGFMKSETEVGYYAAAVKIKTVLVSVVTALGTVMLPKATQLVKEKKMDEFIIVIQKSMRFTLFLAFPLTLFFIMFAKPTILLLSGSKYLPAALPMQIIMPTLILVGVTNVTGIQALIPLGKEKVVMWSVIGGAITDLILNIILIPKYGATGAAIGTLAAELVVLIIQAMNLKIHFALSAWAPYFGNAALAMTVTQYISEHIPNLFAKLAVAGIVCAAMYIMWLYIEDNEVVLEGVRLLQEKKSKKRGEKQELNVTAPDD